MKNRSKSMITKQYRDIMVDNRLFMLERYRNYNRYIVYQVCYVYYLN